MRATTKVNGVRRREQEGERCKGKESEGTVKREGRIWSEAKEK